MARNHSMTIDGRKYHATTTALSGVDSGLIEAQCREFPDLSDYADNEEEAVALLRDSITTTLASHTS